MNWKLVIVGGLVFYIVTFAVGMATGPLIHNGVLKDTYKANSGYWRPELNQDPPDMAALMPRWITTGVITSLILAALYGWIRPAFAGPGWKRGLLYGLFLSIVACLSFAGWSGVFNLPENVWVWWGLESFAYYLPGGAALGWVGGKLAP
jgi:hypothetical protein